LIPFLVQPGTKRRRKKKRPIGVHMQNSGT
jgi:hypothetical protein